MKKLALVFACAFIVGTVSAQSNVWDGSLPAGSVVNLTPSEVVFNNNGIAVIPGQTVLVELSTGNEQNTVISVVIDETTGTRTATTSRNPQKGSN